MKYLLVYKGEKPRSISRCIKNPISHSKKGETEKSAVAERILKTNKLILFNQTKGLVKIPHYYSRIVKEGMEICKIRYKFDKDDYICINTITYYGLRRNGKQY